jgi:hypothetical protein
MQLLFFKYCNEFPYNKTNQMHQFLKFYFGNETLHVSDSSSVHHQELFTVHSAMVYVIQVCRQLSRRITMELQFYPDPASASSWFYYKEICHDARSHERKKKL